MRHPPHPTFALAAMCAAVLAGCGSDSNDAEPPRPNQRPGFIAGAILHSHYDGSSDDLLTAGLGTSGLAAASAPAAADPSSPTATELRRLAIHTNYRALVDTTAAGGYGRLFGPNVDASGHATEGQGLVAGDEYLAFSDDGSRRQNVTLMVQIPAHFDPDNACIQAATSSGSRGIYGGIASGEWGLKRGCAVAYTDKGTGAPAHDLGRNLSAAIDGTLVDADAAGAQALFRADLSEAERADFNASTPHRLAFKHAHSQQNPEKDWGTSTLHALEFAFYVLNERYGEVLADGSRTVRLTPENTVTIASALSNGAGAAIAAAELDTQGLIRGVAVSEPQVQLPASAAVSVLRGETEVPAHSKPLMEYVAYAALLQPCAALAPSLADAPFATGYRASLAQPALPIAPQRCQALQEAGLLAGASVDELAEDAVRQLQAYGWEPEAAPLHASLAGFEVASAVAVSYANAYTRASVQDHLCGYSFATTSANGAVIQTPQAVLAQLAATGNGVPPTSGVQLVNNLGLGSPTRDMLSFSPHGRAEWNLAGALCLYQLATQAPTADRAWASRMRAGLDEVTRTGNLQGKPAIIVHGRADGLLPPNHTSRPYTALNRQVEGEHSQLRYIEVTNAQHFDAFIGLPGVLPGYDSAFIPLHVYLNQALDRMYAHLKDGTPLPPHQLVRTTPRGGTPGSAPALTAAHLPAISDAPAEQDLIAVGAGRIQVPE